MSDLLSHETYQDVRSVLEQSDRPRAVLQAYNAFLHRWAVVRLQESERFFHPRLLALLLLLQYAWREVFDQIKDNPYYFFYLHGLATGIPNSVCDTIDLDEVRALGLPAKAQNSRLYDYRKPGLVNLLKNWTFSGDFDAVSGRNRLSLHITLDAKALEQRPLYQERQAWEALNSGDPAQIKLVAFYEGGKISVDYEQPLKDSIIDLRSELGNDTTPSLKRINDLEAVIFCLGLIGTRKETLDVLYGLLSNIPSSQPQLSLRILYAIQRLETRGISVKSETLSPLIEDILLHKKDEEGQGDRVRVGVARHVQYSKLQTSDLIKLWGLLYQDSGESVFVQRALIESFKNSPWREAALNVLSLEKAPKLLPTDLIEVCEAGPWPRVFGKLFIQIAQETDQELSNRAFALLKGFREAPGKEQTPQDKVQSMEWMGELLRKTKLPGKVVELPSKVVEDFKEFLRKCWNIISELQKDKQVAWQENLWEQLKRTSLEKDDNLMIDGLKTTWRPEAISCLENLRQQAPIHWRSDIEDALVELTNELEKGDAPNSKKDS